jgi:hypothetical protein
MGADGILAPPPPPAPSLRHRHPSPNSHHLPSPVLSPITSPPPRSHPSPITSPRSHPAAQVPYINDAEEAKKCPPVPRSLFTQPA